MFMRNLDHQVRNYANLIELIIVEWNPLGDREPLRDVIYQPENYPVRIITVPSDVHNSIGSTYPVLEFYAKNAGARRARGDFVLLTNPDIIFTQEIIDEFARRDLDPNYFYRTDRFDFNGDGIEDVALDSLVDWILPQVFVGHITQNSISATAPRPPEIALTSLKQLPKSTWNRETVHTNGAGDFVLASRTAFDEVGGMIETTTQRWHIDAYSCVRFYRMGFEPMILTSPMCIFHTDHPRSDMDQDVMQRDMEEYVMAPINTEWGLRNIDLPEWSLSK